MNISFLLSKINYNCHVCRAVFAAFAAIVRCKCLGLLSCLKYSFRQIRPKLLSEAERNFKQQTRVEFYGNGVRGGGPGNSGRCDSTEGQLESNSFSIDSARLGGILLCVWPSNTLMNGFVLFGKSFPQVPTRRYVENYLAKPQYIDNSFIYGECERQS